MEAWQEGFKAALLAHVQKQPGHADAVAIRSWDEETNRYDLGGCDTCGYGADEPYELYIRYTRTDGGVGSFYSTTPFGELVAELIGL